MTGDLSGVDVKICRAKAHAADLTQRVKAATEPDRYAVVRQVNADGSVHSYFIDNPPQVPASWSAIVGDLLHNLRSALDHLAWQLVLLTGGTPDPLKTVFPIRYPGAVPAAAPEIYGLDTTHPAAFDILRAVDLLQPYHTWNKGSTDLLWYVHDLNRIDKHRKLLVAVTASYQAAYGLPIEAVPTLDYLTPHPLEDGDQALVVQLPHPLPNLYLNPNLTLEVILQGGPLVGVDGFMSALIWCVADKVVNWTFRPLFEGGRVDVVTLEFILKGTPLPP
jgi:hypothetical protein